MKFLRFEGFEKLRFRDGSVWTFDPVTAEWSFSGVVGKTWPIVETWEHLGEFLILIQEPIIDYIETLNIST